MPLQTVGTPLLWAGFIVFVLAMLAIDLGVFHRKAHSVSLREAVAWSAVWVALSAAFNVGVYVFFGKERALEFTTAYLVEKALSVDNIFVIAVIFSTFAMPAAYQHRVLFWGILGALVLRAGFILAGGAFVARFHWALYVFGAVLAFTGVRLLFQREDKIDPQKNLALRAARRVLPMTDGHRDGRFVVREGGRLLVTPLLLTLIVVEATDLVFAADSIPAIFGISRDPFIVFTSNVFAILGLRSLYFLLAGVMDRFHYLKIGLALVLIFVGGKMLLEDFFRVPIAASLGVITALIAGAVIASLLRPRPPLPVATEASPS
jgi:tellurite resistance protein TerC